MVIQDYQNLPGRNGGCDRPDDSIRKWHASNFGAAAGFDQKENPTKLRGEEIALMIKTVLEMDDRGFTPELTIFATNPKD